MWAIGAAALLGHACIDVGQIHGPMADSGANFKTPDAATDLAPRPDAPAGSALFGFPCNDNQACAEGTCVDGVCCRSGSCPICQVCGTSGSCFRVFAGEIEPHFRCHPPDPPESCGRSGTCDGAGQCAFYPANLQCVKGTCEGDAVVGAFVCDGNGHCKPGPTRICVPFACNPETSDCYDTCASSSQCVSGQQCQNASCGKRSKGARCQSNDQCVSSYCADGVCCNVACEGACVSCDLQGREGTCWPVDADQPDPRNICRDMGPASCGSTGICDGAGACLRYDETTVCRRTCAADGGSLAISTCDGMGICRLGTDNLTCPTKTCDADMPACR